MSLSPKHRTVAVLTEIVTLVVAATGLASLGPAPTALATVDQPVVAYSVPAPTGITIDSPWITDATGMVAWAMGVDSSGTGVLARRDIASATITTTPTLAGEIGATDGRLITPTGMIAFLVKRQGTGGRLVVINPTTGVRVSSYDLPATDTNPRGIGFSPAGDSIYIGSNQSPALALKIAATTGALVSSVSLSTTPAASGLSYGGKFFIVGGTTAPRLITYKDTPPFALETSWSLAGVGQPLVDPTLVGSTAWFGSVTSPARLVAIDLTTKSITANFALPATFVGLRNITIPTGSTSAYGTTTIAGHTYLESVRLSDGVVLGSTDLGAITGATSISVSGRNVDVMFSGSTALIRTTTAAPPSVPTGISVTESDGALAVRWAPVTSDEPLVTYRVTAIGTDANCVTIATSCTVTGLQNGSVYSITVTATTYAGTSTSSPVVGSPATLPSIPTGVTAQRGDRSALVTWSASEGNGRAVTGYTVTLSPGGQTCSTAGLSCEVSGLTNGTAYSARVVAHSSWGDSQSSAASAAVTPATIPLPPTAVSAVRGDRHVVVLWGAPESDGGDPVVGYRVMSNGVVFCSTSELECEITGLANGTAIEFTVTAVNSVGTSSESASTGSVVPATRSTVPVDVTAVRGDRSVRLNWSVPVDAGGEPITGYTVRDGNDDVVCETDATTCEVMGLTNGRPVSFTVTASNAVGSSEPSAPSPTVTPATLPDRPANVRAVRGDHSAAVTWDAPADDGGEPVGGYSVWSDGAVVCETVETECAVAGLSNGRAVSFTVVAHNAVGESEQSDPSESVVPATIPSAPPAVVVVRGDTVIDVSWDAPSDGGEPVIGYTVTTVPESDGCSTWETLCTLRGLQNGIEYTVIVTAHNAIGDGATSEPATATPEPPVIPDPPVVPEPPAATVPSSPTRIALAKVTAKKYTLSWRAPATGGSAIIDYRVDKKVSGASRYSRVSDGVSSRRTVTLPRPAAGKTLYVRITSVNAVGQSNPPTVVKLKGKKIYAMPSVLAVRVSDAAAFFGSDARSTPNDGTSLASGFAQSSFL